MINVSLLVQNTSYYEYFYDVDLIPEKSELLLIKVIYDNNEFIIETNNKIEITQYTNNRLDFILCVGDNKYQKKEKFKEIQIKGKCTIVKKKYYQVF